MTYQLPETSATLAFGGSEWESEWISSEDAYSAEQMQQAYADGRESMREECLQECSAEATDNGTAQRIEKAIEGIK